MLFEVKKYGIFLFGISFYVLEIFNMFWYYANEESDDDINSSTRTLKSPEILEQGSSNLAPGM